MIEAFLREFVGEEDVYLLFSDDFEYKKEIRKQFPLKVFKLERKASNKLFDNFYMLVKNEETMGDLIANLKKAEGDSTIKFEEYVDDSTYLNIPKEVIITDDYDYLLDKLLAAKDDKVKEYIKTRLKSLEI